MANARKNGLPRSSYAYAPTSNPDDWKLPYLTASGAPDPNHLPGAAAALSPGGFRGNPVNIPADAVPMVKAKLRRAYSKWGKKPADFPASIKEGEQISEAAVLLDRASESGQVAVCPSCGDTLVIPNYTGQFSDLTTPAPETPADPHPNWDAQDALDILAKLVQLKATEAAQGDAADVSTIDTALNALIAFLGHETAEIKSGMCLICNDDYGCNCDSCDCDSSVHYGMAESKHAESGKRNSARDEATLRQIQELIKQLGVSEPKSAPEPVAEPTIEPVAEADIQVTGDPEDITFRESGYEGGSIPMNLREAGAIFDDEKKEIIITPIRPGFGNKKDKYYYPTSTLKEAVSNGVFRKNVKMYANHPAKAKNGAAEDRNVWDWVSTIKETWWDDSKQEPKSRVKVYDDRFWERAKAAPDEIAFSILGGGRSRLGRVNNEEARIVESLGKVDSVDWVHEAGAGGAIDSFAESAHEEYEMELEKLTAEQLREARPDLVEALLAESAKGAEAEETPAEETEATETPEAPVAEAAAEEETTTEEIETPAVETPAVEAPVAESATTSDDKDDFRAEFEALKAKFAAMEAKDAEAAAIVAESNAKAEADRVIDAAIGASTLPKVAKDAVRERFAESTVGNGYIYSDDESLKEAVEKELGLQQKVVDELVSKRRVVASPGVVEEPRDESVRESVFNSLAGRLADTVKPENRQDAIVATPADAEDDESEPVAARVSESGKSVQDSISQRLFS